MMKIVLRHSKANRLGFKDKEELPLEIWTYTPQLHLLLLATHTDQVTNKGKKMRIASDFSAAIS